MRQVSFLLLPDAYRKELPRNSRKELEATLQRDEMRWQTDEASAASPSYKTSGKGNREKTPQRDDMHIDDSMTEKTMENYIDDLAW